MCAFAHVDPLPVVLVANGCCPRSSERWQGTARVPAPRLLGRGGGPGGRGHHVPPGAYGPDSVGCFGGGGLTKEKAHTFGKFARVALRPSMIDYNGRLCMSSAATARNRLWATPGDWGKTPAGV